MWGIVKVVWKSNNKSEGKGTKWKRGKERCQLVSRRFQVAAGSALEKRGSSLLKIHVGFVVVEVDEYLHRLPVKSA